MEWKQSLCNILVGIICCLLPFSLTSGASLFGNQLCLTICALLVTCILAVILYISQNITLSITKNDVFVFLYLLYGGIHFLVYRENLPLSLFIHWTILITIYIICRNINNQYLPFFLWIGCTLQAIIGVLQFTGILESSHSLFHVTGCFWNPSQLGGFIACFFPLFVSDLLTRKCSVVYWLGLLLMVCSLVLSDSRAAWLACVIGILYVLPFKFKGKILVGLASFGLVLMSLGLYFYKPLSALGRLYVWWICKDMIRENLFWGNGIHSFRDEYMLYQADYFHAYPESDFAGMATSVTTPYNEFLHVFVEQGLVGFLLFLLLFGSYFYTTRYDYNKKYKGVIFSFLLFGIFSYPGENIALLFGLVMCMGAVRVKELWRIRFSFSRKFVIVMMLVGCIYMNIKIFEKYYSLNVTVKQPLEHVYSYYKNEPDVLLYLLRANKSLNISDRLVIQEWITRKKPTPETCCELGCLYEQQHKYDKAEKYYQIAANMVPNQVRANYFLFKLYQTTGRVMEAYQMAVFISQQNIKIENTFTLGVQGEIKRYLENEDNF